MKALCERCGSIRIVRASSTLPDALVRVFTAKRPFFCQRCGWRGRRNWTDKDLRQLLDYGAGGAEADPALAVLDGEPSLAGRQERLGGTLRKSEPSSTEGFDIGALAFAFDELPVEPSPDQEHPVTRRRRSGRRRSSRRRAAIQRVIAAALAATALIVFLVIVFSLTGDQ